MKFIREIISGKQGASGRPSQTTAGDRPGSKPGSVPDVAPETGAAVMRPEPAPAPRGDDAADDLHRLVPGASWLRSAGKSDLSRNIAAAVQEREGDPTDEAYAPAAARRRASDPDVDAFDIDSPTGAESFKPDTEDDIRDDDGYPLTGEVYGFSLTDDDDMADGDDDDPGLFDDDPEESDESESDRITEQDENEGDGLPGFPEHRAPLAALRQMAAMPSPRQGMAPAPSFARNETPAPTMPRPAATAPERRTFAGQPVPRAPLVARDPAPVAPPQRPEREVTALRDFRQDPFNRLDRRVVSQPVAASPFQKSPERPASGPMPRPRTKLAENLTMPIPALDSVEVPAPAVGRAARRAERVKTRLLGFGDASGEPNPFEAATKGAGAGASKFPVGWMVVTGGPGRGHCFTLLHGVSQIGRGENQAIRLDFGDTSISRANHAAIAYDPENRKFFLGHGGKANLVRLNGKPVLSTEELPPGGVIHIGETTLQFVALCGAGFDWDKNHDDDVDAAVFG